MKMSKLQWYILREVVSPFLVGVFFFTVLFIAPKLRPLVSLNIEKNIPASTVFQLLIYILPATTVLTIPMGTLFGALFSLGRLSGDSEIIAMRANGISLWSICKPIVFFSVVTTIGLFFFFNYVMSAANLRYKTLYANAVYSSPGIMLEENTFVNLPGNTKKMTALSIDEETKEMKSVYIYEKKKNSKEISMIYANRGLWLSNEINSSLIKLNLYDGELIRLDDSKQEGIERIKFDEMKVNFFNHIKQIDTAHKGLREQNVFEVWDLINDREKKKVKISPIIWVEFHKKISIPLACMIFVLTAIPLGITNVRSGKGSSLGWALIIIFIYYVFLSSGEAMGKNAVIPPQLGIYLPNIAVGIMGIVLFIRKLKE